MFDAMLDEIVSWAKEQGFPTTIPANDMHVTIVFSRTPVDWMKSGETYDQQIIIPPSGVRMIEKFGENAIVLLFNSAPLSWRHEQIAKDTGASWDWPEYEPHITITWNPGGFDWQSVEPYRGEIVLGPEIFEEVKEDWESTIQEDSV